MDVIGLLRGLLGMAVILGIALLVSSGRRNVNWRMVAGGLSIQLVLAVFILKGEAMGAVFAPLGWPKAFFSWLSQVFVLILQFTSAGSEFLFGPLALGPEQDGSLGFYLAFQVLPVIIFFASLMSILYYLGIMQKVVQGMAWLVSKVLKTSGAESLSVSANVFVGQTEAPLVIKPFLEKMTRSELMAIMTGGMATIAGSVMASYIKILGDTYAQAAGVPIEVGQQLFAEQLLGASLMAAPAALILAKIIIPETGKPLTSGTVKVDIPSEASNVIDAAAAGASDGLKLAANVGAMLLAFLALIAMLNFGISSFAGLFGLELTLEKIFGFALAPIAWLIGVEWADAVQFGSLLGTKVVTNEFVAYIQLSANMAEGVLAPKTVLMATFALCGFANFSSIAIQIGGIGPMAPSRTSELAELGLRAVLAGTLANMMTATIAGVLAG